MSWPANGSFVYVNNFFYLFCFVVVVVLSFFFEGEDRNVKGERGSCGRRCYIVLCIHVNILTVMDRMTVVANGTKQ